MSDTSDKPPTDSEKTKENLVSSKESVSSPGTPLTNKNISPSHQDGNDMTADDLAAADLVDTILAEEDPEFLKSLNSISQDKELGILEESENVLDPLKVLEEERKKWKQGHKISQFIFKIFPWIVFLSVAFKKASVAIKKNSLATLIRIKILFLGGLSFFKYLGREVFWKGAKHFLKKTKEGLSKFKSFSLKRKLGVIFSFILLLGAIGFSWLSYKKGVVPHKFDLFILNLEKKATAVYFYDPENETEPFYENLRIANHTLLMPKFYVNLKVSKGSGPRPMAALEIFIEGMAPEVVIEIKDREVEFKDRVSRIVEGFTFETLEDPEGKKQLRDKIRKEMNTVLTTGKVKDIFLKNMIIKP